MNTKRQSVSAQARRSASLSAAGLFEREPLAELAREHAPGRAIVDDGRDRDFRVAGVEGREIALVLGFELVVELLAKALGDLVVGGFRVDAFRRERRDEALGDAGVLEVAFDGGRDAGVLDFHGDGAAVGKPCAVDLADGGAREGLRVEAREESLDGTAELFFDDLPDGGGRRARRRIAELCHARARSFRAALRDDAVHVAQRLADLGGEPAQRAEHVGGVFGGVHAALREHEAGSRACSDARHAHEALQASGRKLSAVVRGHSRES